MYLMCRTLIKCGIWERILSYGIFQWKENSWWQIICRSSYHWKRQKEDLLKVCIRQRIQSDGQLHLLLTGLTSALNGLFDGLEERHPIAGHIAEWLTKAFIAVKIANITGIGTLVGSLISAAPALAFFIPSAQLQSTVILLLVLLGFSGIAYINSHFFVKIFDKYIPEETSEPDPDCIVDHSQDPDVR